MSATLRPHLRFGRWSRLPLIRQAEAAECGLACLAMVAGYHGLDTDLTTLRRRFPVSLKGATLADVIATAAALKLSSRALRCEPEDFGQIRLPAILHWEFKHFVVLSHVGRSHVTVFDPAVGERRIPKRELDESFTGVVLELSPSADFRPRRERETVDVFNLIRLTPDVVKALLMQEDRLLAGSIAENIALFDDRPDMERVRDCARLALVDEEIMRMPMQYHSLVGDMGTSLSSGQKQRVLIARALYRRPRLLILDEGTAHLDPAREVAVREMLRALPVTRVIVAHSPAMTDVGDRVLTMHAGALVPAPPWLEVLHEQSSACVEPTAP